MKGTLIARRYGVGLTVSVLDREYERINRELESFYRAFQETKLGEILVSYFIPMKRKKEMIEELVSRYDFHKKTRNFLILLLERNRMEIFPLVMDSFHQFWDQKHNIHTFEMITAIKINNTTVERVRKALEGKFKGEIRITPKADPSIIGGVVLKKGYIIYDGSIRRQLELIKRKIVEGE